MLFLIGQGTQDNVQTEAIIFEILKLFEVWIRIQCGMGQKALKEVGLALSKVWK